MPRYKLTIEYDGTAFVGWQKQANGLSIQEAIETAGEPLGAAVNGLRGAGRTDACEADALRAEIVMDELGLEDRAGIGKARDELVEAEHLLD